MEVVFLKAKQRLIKEISLQGKKPYPLAKNFTSYHHDIEKTPEGFTEFYNLLIKYAQSGAALHKGLLKKKLKSVRDLVEDISTGDLNKRVNRYIKKNIRKDLTSHSLRGFYAHYLFHTNNPENKNINGFLTDVLNHECGTSSLNYSNYTFEK